MTADRMGGRQAASRIGAEQEDLTAALILLTLLGVSPEDLIIGASAAGTVPVPTFAEYVPIVAAAASGAGGSVHLAVAEPSHPAAEAAAGDEGPACSEQSAADRYQRDRGIDRYRSRVGRLAAALAYGDCVQARRGGAPALRPCDVNDELCTIRLREKGGTTREQPVSPTLAADLLAHAQARPGAGPRGGLLRHRDGSPISASRYASLWARLHRHLPWIGSMGITAQWIRGARLVTQRRVTGERRRATRP